MDRQVNSKASHNRINPHNCNPNPYLAQSIHQSTLSYCPSVRDFDDCLGNSQNENNFPKHYIASTYWVSVRAALKLALFIICSHLGTFDSSQLESPFLIAIFGCSNANATSQVLTTFSTVGYGDITPTLTSVSEIVVVGVSS